MKLHLQQAFQIRVLIVLLTENYLQDSRIKKISSYSCNHSNSNNSNKYYNSNKLRNNRTNLKLSNWISKRKRQVELRCWIVIRTMWTLLKIFSVMHLKSRNLRTRPLLQSSKLSDKIVSKSNSSRSHRVMPDIKAALNQNLQV